MLIQDSTEVATGGTSDTENADETVRRSAAMKPDRFLSPLSIDESSDPTGPCESESGERCSDKGYLPRAMPIEVRLHHQEKCSAPLGSRIRS